MFCAAAFILSVLSHTPGTTDFCSQGACLYVTISGESSPCMPLVVLDFAAVSYLVPWYA